MGWHRLRDIVDGDKPGRGADGGSTASHGYPFCCRYQQARSHHRGSGVPIGPGSNRAHPYSAASSVGSGGKHS